MKDLSNPTNKGVVFKRTIIFPEGFLGDKDCLIFEEGLWQCGDAVNGMGVNVGLKSGGGVIKNEDLLKLRNAINRHLYKVKRGETAPSSPTDVKV